LFLDGKRIVHQPISQWAAQAWIRQGVGIEYGKIVFFTMAHRSYQQAGMPSVSTTI